MKNKLIFFLITFIACGMVVGNSAEPSAASKQAPPSNQPPETALQTLQIKLGQARASLSEIQDLLKQEEKILAGTRALKEQSKKSEAALAEHDRAANVLRQEIQKLRDQVKEAEKELAAQTKQAEDYSRVQAEYSRAQKERADDELKVQQAEDKLAAAQKSLAELKSRLTETMKEVNEAKKRSQDLENTKALLETEKTKRVEALARAEKAVAMAEKAEKERLILAGRVTEFTQNIPPQQQDSPERVKIAGELEIEKKAIAETEEKIRKEDKARNEDEKAIVELKKQLQMLQKTERSGDSSQLQSRLDSLRKQRLEAEKRLKDTESKLQESEQSLTALTNMITTARKQEENNKGTAQNITTLKNEIEKEASLLKGVEERLDKQSRDLKTLEGEKNQLNKQLLRVREQAGKDGGALNEIGTQLAEQKRLRLEAEARLQAAGQKREVLEKEKDQLKLALNANRDQPKQSSADQARLERELEGERRTLLETEKKIKKDDKAREEVAQTVVELKKQLQALQKTERVQSEESRKNLQVQLEKVRGQRNEAEAQMKKTEGKLKESEESATALTNMIAVAERQQEKDKETAKNVATLANELEKETTLMNEVAVCLDKENRNLKAVEEEKIRLEQRLILVKEKLSREEQNVSKIDEISLRVAEQKKIRADIESKLQQTIRDRDALEKGNEQLNQALIEAGNLILKNEKDLKTAGRVADELQKEKELARKSADLLREREQSLKQFADEKARLQNKLNEAEARLAQQKARAGDLEKKRRALDEEKKAKLASEKKYDELAQTEKEDKGQIKELKKQVSATTRKSELLSSQAKARASAGAADKSPGQETLVVSQAKTGSSQNSTTAGSEVKETRDAEKAPGSSGKDALSVEQDILNKARAGDQQPSGQDIGADQRQEKKAAKQTGSRSRQSQLAQAEEHYALGIQKWDENDLDGAVAEFKNVTRLNPDAAGAYYNISLVYLRQGMKEEACNYAYKAGECYIKVNNLTQAARMAVLLVKIDQNSPLVRKLRNKIATAKK